MRHLGSWLIVTAVAMYAASGHAAQPGAHRREQVFASLPNWSGIWEAEVWSKRTPAGKPVDGIEGLRAQSQLMAHLPYNPEWEARFQEGMKNVEALRGAEQSRKSCSFGFPMGMESPAIFEIALTPEQALFVFVTQDVRHVYTDGRPHAPDDERWPTRMGDSIGHWEGQTLVIETVSRLATAPVSLTSSMSKVSEQAKFTERVRLVSDSVLEDEMTLEDPVALTRPWTVKIRYHRLTDLNRMVNYDCSENDRNPVVDGKLTVAPPAR